MSSGYDDTPSKTVSERIIEDAQLRVQDARSEYHQAKLTGINGANELVEAQLHSAVLNYYDALQRVRDQRTVKDFWESVKLWPIRPKTIEVVGCQQCGTLPPADTQPEPGQTCPECEAEFVPVVVYQRAETGEIEYEWQRGFDTLANLSAEVEVVEETVSGFLGTRTRRREVANRIDGDTLVDISRKLDDAAAKCGFAPQTPTPNNDDADPI